MREKGKSKTISEMSLSVIDRDDATICFSTNRRAARLELVVKTTDGTSRSYLTLCPILYRGFHLIRYVAV